MARTGKNSSATGAKVKSPHRRVVKGTVPPPTIQLDETLPEADPGVSEKERNMNPSIKDPSVMHEEEQELTERWRKERLDTNAEKHDERRDQKIEERRKHSRSFEISNDQLDNKSHSDVRVLPEFSVQPKFPEHKRSVENTYVAASPHGDEPEEKRLRASNTNDSSEEKSKGRFWNALSSRMKIVIPAAAVAGLAVLVAAKLLKKR